MRCNSLPDFLKLKSRLSYVTEDLLLEQYRRLDVYMLIHLFLTASTVLIIV